MRPYFTDLKPVLPDSLCVERNLGAVVKCVGTLKLQSFPSYEEGTSPNGASGGGTVAMCARDDSLSLLN